jgi:hypothetical protein
MKQFVRRFAKDDRALKMMARADQLKADLLRLERSGSGDVAPDRDAQPYPNYAGRS